MLVTVEHGRAIAGRRRPEPSVHPRLPLREGQPLPRAHVPPRPAAPLHCGASGRRAAGASSGSRWDEAIGEIADAAATRSRESTDGPQAILPYWYAGHDGPDPGLVDGPAVLPPARRVAARPDHLLHGRHGRDADDRRREHRRRRRGMPQSDLVLLWGTNTLTANPHLWPFVLEARKRGAPIIAIDPIRTRTAEQCDEWIADPPRHRRRARARDDARPVRRAASRIATTSSATRSAPTQLRERVREYTPERVAPITGIAARRPS